MQFDILIMAGHGQGNIGAKPFGVLYAAASADPVLFGVVTACDQAGML